MEQNLPDKPAPKSEPASPTVVDFMSRTIREVIAIFFWLYVFLKLFVFDVDVFLIKKVWPEHVWLLDFKFFILIGLLAVLWLITKNKQILSWSAYILSYPLIVVFWRIPVFVFKQKSWVFALACLNAVISFFRSIKYNFIASAFLLVSLAVALTLSSKLVLWPAIAIILLLLLIIYGNRFMSVFRPSSILQAYTTMFSWIRKRGASSFALDETIRNVPVINMDQSQLVKRTTNLQLSVLFNRACLFSARKLRDYQNSGVTIVSGVVATLLLIGLTVFCFAVINYALFKIDSALFATTASPAFFTFFYYSFNNLLFNQINDIVPALPLSQAASMLENFFALFLVVIFVSIMLPVRSQRHTDELNQTIKSIQEEAEAMEIFIRQEYELNTIEDAIVELEKAKSIMVAIIFQMTNSIKDK